MMRDLDLVKSLLLVVEQNPEMDGKTDFVFESAQEIDSLGYGPKIIGHSSEEIGYHFKILIEEDFVDGVVDNGYTIPTIRCLRWKGHEFLDNIKNDDVWEATKKRIADLPGIALSAVASIALAEIKKKLGLPG